MTTRRDYAHEVVTDTMHNQVPNLLTAQRARDETERLREVNAELLAALEDIAIQSLGHHLNAEVNALSVVFGDKARAAIAKAR